MQGWMTMGILVLCALLLIVWFQYRARSQRQGKVVRMDKFKKQPDKRGQKCSYCKKKSDRLTFYAGVHGSAVGVCKDCKPKAEKQDLMPI
ncbi:hypothetical protein ACFQ88_01545 [Paenibacillus sp. NPDC056579]|uniref:hypothetical protein n=1 Tax=unclassified Paenibacillus TaxID=185978 RepID=UPI001EF78187|nr:hypothetical protein [Paenibacillus sp. H1-7]ULL15737.1 hypothetical protein DVH26_15560 [Paenibacillus sp. H1-7]